MARGKKPRQNREHERIVGRELLAAVERIEAGLERVKSAGKILKEAREAAANSGWNMSHIAQLLADRRKQPDQLALALEREDLARDELAVYRDALAALPIGATSDEIPVEPLPLEAAIAAEGIKSRLALEAGAACPGCGVPGDGPHEADCASLAAAAGDVERCPGCGAPDGHAEGCQFLPPGAGDYVSAEIGLAATVPA